MIKLINILKEITEGKQIGEIYHFTSLDSTPDILESGKLEPSPDRSEKLGFISFTRNRALSTLGGFKSQVRITIDGDKLSNKYQILPYAQLKPEVKRDEKDWDTPYSRSTQNSESELIIPSKKYSGKINITPYIKKLDIIIYDDMDTYHEDQIGEINKINNISKKLNIPVEYYKYPNRKNNSYWSPQKNKTVN
jgi:hypothetical protein